MKNIQTIALNTSIARSTNLAKMYKDNDRSEMYNIFAEMLIEDVTIKAKMDIGQELTRFEQIHLEAVVRQFKKDVAEA